MDSNIGKKLDGRYELLELIGKCTDQRMFAMYEAIARGVTLEKLHEITKIDYFFLHKYLNLYNMECRLKEGNIDAETYLRAKKMGYPDNAIERLSGGGIRGGNALLLRNL